jgi:lipopolysaccharide export system permease protein
MNLVQRYLFKIAGSAFLTTALALTGVIWLTQALRELNLVTGKGQTILVFLQVTLFSLPALIMVIAPLALFIAVIYTLNKLNADSELIVMNAAGMSPSLILKPLILLSLLVSLGVGFITLYAMSESFRALRGLISKVRADIVTKIVQEGKFVTLDAGIVFHFREKLPNGAMGGVMIDDSRDPKLTLTYLAERGIVMEIDGTTYLILDKGSMQRQDRQQRNNSIVAFDRYVFDLDQFEKGSGVFIYKPRERSTWELLFTLDKNDPYVRSIAGRFRAELHDRLTNPLYPLASLAIAFAALGSARTTRQGRGEAIFMAVIALILLRIAGFGAASFAVRSPVGVYAMYLVPVASIALAAWLSARAILPRRPSPMIERVKTWLHAPLALFLDKRRA